MLSKYFTFEMLTLPEELERSVSGAEKLSDYFNCIAIVNNRLLCYSYSSVAMYKVSKVLKTVQIQH